MVTRRVLMLLQPLVVNRHLQSIVQHPQFFKLCNPDHPSRDALVNLLHTLFHLHPRNTCHPTHIQPLIRVYGGTTTASDHQLLAVFQLFEAQRKVSVAPLLAQWSSPSTTSSNALEAIRNLDSVQVFRTCLAFPMQSMSAKQRGRTGTERDMQLYDPLFLILLFSCMLSTCPPDSKFAWIDLFRSNIVCLLIRALSTKDAGVREIALCQLAGLWKCLQVWQ